MKHAYLSTAFILLFAACTTEAPHQPAPTEVAPGVTEGDDAGSARLAWIEYMHKTADGVSWRGIEADNRRAERARLAGRTRDLAARGVRADSIAPGLYGTWHERGSTNQAGSVQGTDYRPGTDELYTVGAGGSLWAGPADGSAWRVVNQEYRFEPYALEILEGIGPRGFRILAAVDGQPAYSDDDGATWTVTADLDDEVNRWGYVRDYTTYAFGTDTLIFALTSRGYWEANELAVSDDRGASWRLHPTPGIVLGNLATHNDLIADPSGDGAPLVLGNDGLVARLLPDGLRVVGLHPNLTGDDRAQLTASTDGDSLYLYTYDADDLVHVSTDTGATWRPRGTLPVRPWSVGIQAHPADPSRLVMGAVDAYTSSDGGLSWRRVNRWSDYYADVANKLHADMMSFHTFARADGSLFSTSANHGGMYVSDDYYRTNVNVGMDGLNVSQYYSVAYHEAYPDHLFVGTQDQGFQRGVAEPEELSPLEQAISGDYGHLTFTQDGEELWMMYPGTAVSVYARPATGGYTDWLTVESADETVWLAPMTPHPDPSERSVFAAGGSVVDDGPGSYLLHLSLDPQTRTIVAEEYDFDFRVETGGVLSALEISPLSDARLFAATDNGRFLVSEDAGRSWEQRVNFIPDGHYLYGQAIAASPVRDSTVWVAGSGYSGPGVFRSDDLGVNFFADVDGLPSTMVFELATSPDGQWLYAATEAGPYAQYVPTRTWYPLSVPGVPNQTFWSVTYATLDSTVRFATYGRGVWDLALSSPPDTVDVSARNLPEIEVSVFPNPASSYVEVVAQTDLQHVRLLDLQGREVLSFRQNQPRARLDVGGVPRGTYVVEVRGSDGGRATHPIVLH